MSLQRTIRLCKAKRLKEILLFIGDGFRGLQQACQEIYPRANFQYCWVHITYVN
ncbi:MAG: transposase [Veillonella sp.]|nr:transposase [Veillonella sp.]